MRGRVAHLDFIPANCGGQRRQLAVAVRAVDVVAVQQHEAADARAAQHLCAPGADAAKADNGHARVCEPHQCIGAHDDLAALLPRCGRERSGGAFVTVAGGGSGDVPMQGHGGMAQRGSGHAAARCLHDASHLHERP